MAQNDVEEFLLERMQSPKGLGDVMASVGEGLACHPRGAREDSVFHLLCSFEMFPLHGEQNPQDVRLPVCTHQGWAPTKHQVGTGKTRNAYIVGLPEFDDRIKTNFG